MKLKLIPLILIAIFFAQCEEYEVSESVEALRQARLAEIAAQAQLSEAEAALMAAQTKLAESEAAMKLAQVSVIEAEARLKTIEADAAVAQLEYQKEMNSIYIELAKVNLEAEKAELEARKADAELRMQIAQNAVELAKGDLENALAQQAIVRERMRTELLQAQNAQELAMLNAEESIRLMKKQLAETKNQELVDAYQKYAAEFSNLKYNQNALLYKKSELLNKQDELAFVQNIQSDDVMLDAAELRLETMKGDLVQLEEKLADLNGLLQDKDLENIKVKIEEKEAEKAALESQVKEMKIVIADMNQERNNFDLEKAKANHELTAFFKEQLFLGYDVPYYGYYSNFYMSFTGDSRVGDIFYGAFDYDPSSEKGFGYKFFPEAVNYITNVLKSEITSAVGDTLNYSNAMAATSDPQEIKRNLELLQASKAKLNELKNKKTKYETDYNQLKTQFEELNQVYVDTKIKYQELADACSLKEMEMYQLNDKVTKYRYAIAELRDIKWEIEMQYGSYTYTDYYNSNLFEEYVQGQINNVEDQIANQKEDIANQNDFIANFWNNDSRKVKWEQRVQQAIELLQTDITDLDKKIAEIKVFVDKYYAEYEALLNN